MALIKIIFALCLCLCLEQFSCHPPALVEPPRFHHQPPPHGVFHFRPPVPAAPIVAGSVKTKTFVPPVTRVRAATKTTATKTIVRPLPPPPVTNQIVETEVFHPVGAAEPYDFNYNYNDNHGTNQYRKEEGDTRGVVRGSYGYTDPNGLYRVVEYIADENGFRANIKSNEPGLVDSGVGSPADITLSAEESPRNVLDLIKHTPRGSWDNRLTHRSTRVTSRDDKDTYKSFSSNDFSHPTPDDF